MTCVLNIDGPLFTAPVSEGRSLDVQQFTYCELGLRDKHSSDDERTQIQITRGGVVVENREVILTVDFRTAAKD